HGRERSALAGYGSSGARPVCAAAARRCGDADVVGRLPAGGGRARRTGGGHGLGVESSGLDPRRGRWPGSWWRRIPAGRTATTHVHGCERDATPRDQWARDRGHRADGGDAGSVCRGVQRSCEGSGYVARSQSRDDAHGAELYTIFTKSSPLNRPLPHTASRSVSGFAAIDSSSDLPAALSRPTRSRAVTSMSRYCSRSVFVATRPWPGTIFVSTATRPRTRFAASIIPSMRPPVDQSMNG